MRQDINVSGGAAGVRRFVQESARTRSPVGGRASVTDDAGNGVAWRSPGGQAGGEMQATCTLTPLLRRTCSLVERNRSAMGYAATSCQGTHLRGMVVFVKEIVHVLRRAHSWCNAWTDPSDHPPPVPPCARCGARTEMNAAPVPTISADHAGNAAQEQLPSPAPSTTALTPRVTPYPGWSRQHTRACRSSRSGISTATSGVGSSSTLPTARPRTPRQTRR
ncbi:MAG: hypothetical protein KatS3mg058_4128 [Roseiflexus sp.]|nr:MAG: hypothetical protein KatS3mg058_4128 [Roseiflexus sp.]